MNEIKYELDFYGWTQEQARLLREGRFSELDMQNLVEEVESLGRRERNQLEPAYSIASTPAQVAVSAGFSEQELAGEH